MNERASVIATRGLSAFSPPLIVEEAQLDEVFTTVGEVLKETAWRRCLPRRDGRRQKRQGKRKRNGTGTGPARRIVTRGIAESRD